MIIIEYLRIRTLTALTPMFSAVFKTYLWKAVQTFSPKRLLILKFVIDVIISNWTSCHTIQRVIVLVISKQPRSSRLSDVKLLTQLLAKSYLLCLINKLRANSPFMRRSRMG